MTQNKIKVVHVVEGFIGGLATYMSHVLPGLVQNGFDVTFICSLDRKEQGMMDKLQKICDAKIKIHYVPMRRSISPFYDIYCFLLLFRLFRNNQYDVVHTHCSKAGFLGRLAAFCAGISIRLHSSHCFAYLRHSKPMNSIYYLAERILGLFTTKYIAVSPSELENAQKAKIFSSTKSILVENGIPQGVSDIQNDKIRMIKLKWRIPEDTFVITTGCRYVNYKGLDLLVGAAMRVKCRCCFIIAGEGMQKKELEQRIAHFHLSNKVYLLTPGVSIEELLHVSDAAILCSEIEAQPYFLLEAMLARCPIVATDVPGNRELIGNQRGLLVPRSSEAIAQGIDMIFSDKNLRTHFAKSAYDYVVQNHTLQKQLEKLSQIYRKEYEVSLSNISQDQHVKIVSMRKVM